MSKHPDAPDGRIPEEDELGTLDRNGHTWNGRRAWTWTYISDFDRSGYV